MSQAEGTCAYTAGPDEYKRWGGSEYEWAKVLDRLGVVDEGVSWLLDPAPERAEGIWDCPHEAIEGANRCPFHLPAEERPVDIDIQASLREALERSTKETDGAYRYRQFVGARLPRVSLSGFTLSVDDDWPVAFIGATIADQVDFSSATVESLVSFRRATVGGRVDFSRASLGNGATFRSATIGARVEFDLATVSHSLSFVDATVDGEGWFGFTGDVTTFYGPVSFNDASFEGGLHISDATQFYHHPPVFQGADINQSSFTDADLSRADFTRTDLTESEFRETTLQNAQLERSKLSRTELFGADLRGARLAGALMGDARVNEATRFLGPPDNTDEEGFIARFMSRPCCVYDPAYAARPARDGAIDWLRNAVLGGTESRTSETPSESEEERDTETETVDEEEPLPEASRDSAKSVYRMLERVAGVNARPQLQAHAFVRRQDVQRSQYHRLATEATEAVDRMRYRLRHLRASVARWTFLYGESPWRIIAWSVGIVVFFAILYPLGLMETSDGSPLTVARIQGDPTLAIESLYYSTLTFTALGFGDFRPANMWGQVATIVETSLGAVLLALLVFVLGRRAAR
jgi:uncharacterized protein YjbI with pentapeptide repeats